MKKRNLLIILTALLSLLISLPAAARQVSPELEIDLNRDFGYGGFGNEIQGTFSLRADGPDNLAEVSFYMDETLLGKDTLPPFAVQFNTDNYPPGQHQYYATGMLSDGSQLRSRQITANVLSSEDSMGRTLTIVGPILGIALLAVVLGAVVPALMGKKGKAGPIGEYRLAGGAICPRCSFPFSRNSFSPNLVFGKLERCPHCGKWSIRPRASQAALFEAEERLRAAQEEKSGVASDPQDRLRAALDDSRYEE